MRQKRPVLIVEDDVMQQETLKKFLRRNCDLESVCVGDGLKAINFMGGEEGKSIRLVIMDLDMPVMGGLEALEIMKKKFPAVPVVILTGRKNIDEAVEAIRLGAADFINKPFDAQRISVTVKNSLKMSALSREVSRLRSENSGKFTFDNLIGADTGLLEAVNMGRKAATTDLPVLVTGETGTGKEMMARAIHGESDRHDGPFVAVNCGAIPMHLVESTLFGHEKGAFTGATQKVIGKFREADGGTIFLDEVGELPLQTQVKFLRVLQQKEVEPVGRGIPVPVNVRVISATNRNLQEQIENQNFREDLFYRLNVLEIDMPPLRERREDIMTFVDYFMDRYYLHSGDVHKELSEELNVMFSSYDWPGNVREMENVINRAMVVNNGGPLSVDDLSVAIKGMGHINRSKEVNENNGKRHFSYSGTIRIISEKGEMMPFREIEFNAIRIALDYFNGNVSRAAKALGMTRTTFYRKMKRM